MGGLDRGELPKRTLDPAQRIQAQRLFDGRERNVCYSIVLALSFVPSRFGIVTVLSIDWWSADADRGRINVRAVVDDAIVLQGSFEDPAEFAPGLCKASVICEPEDWPNDEKEQEQWLNSYGPEWRLVEEL